MPGKSPYFFCSVLIACFGPCYFSRLKIWQKWIKMQMFLWPEVEVEMIGLHSSSQLGSWYFIFCCKADHSRAISTSTQGPKMSTDVSTSPILQCGFCMTPVITLVSTCAVLEASLLKQLILEIVTGHVPDSYYSSRNKSLQVRGCCASQGLGLMPKKNVLYT